tara:strand:+ start:210 stop:1343 length:1134 start_codon:yes stop_codon:yes gene_type:complete
MSRTLKRPMFRDGGRANSKGTGIMSGIEDREPYAVGGTTLDPYVSGPFTPGPKPKFGDTLFSIGPDSAIAQGQRNRMLDFIDQTVPGIRKEGSSFSLIPSAAASELPIITSSPKKTEEEKPEEKPETTKINQSSGAGLDEDLDDIKLEDFEEDITKKAEIYEKLLGGKDARAQAAFRALTAGGLEALEEGSVVSGLKKGFEELEGVDDLSRKARLLAIQEKIAKDAQKTPTKAQEVDILAKRYMDNGMNRADAYTAAEKKVYGTEKSQLLSAYSPERELQDLTSAFAKSDDDLIKQNPSGFAQAELYKRQGVKTISYESYYDAENERSDYRPTITPGDISAGDVYFDPVSFQFFYKNKAGETGSSYSLEEAKTKASG